MKKMTIEEKAKAYDEVVKRANELLYVNDKESLQYKTIKHILPELKEESEDEKIRKELLQIAKESEDSFYMVMTPDKRKHLIDWLEKQSEHANFRNKIQVGDKVTRNEDGVLVNLSQLKRVAKPSEKQGKQKPADKVKPKFHEGDWVVNIEYGNVVRVLEVLEDNYRLDYGEDTIGTLCTELVDSDYRLWDISKDAKPSEKQGEKKPTDEVEPKFHEGDWIVIDRPCQIISINDNGDYIVQYCDDENTHILSKKFCESYFHIWTIRDTKDGDVLACNNGWTCIFKTLVNDETFSSYCFMDNTKWFCETGSECHTLKEEFVKAYNGKIYPATKEQRDTLEKAMTDAGYTFDFGKKELKKIEQKPDTDFSDLRTWKYIVDAVWTEKEGIGQYLDSPFTEEVAKKLQKRFGDIKQKPAWSEEDTAMFYGVIETEQYMLDVVYGRRTFAVGDESIKEACSKELAWLQSLKERFQPQQKVEWSEEDKNMLQSILDEYGSMQIEKRNWLKSLKSRVQLKQEWKQENTGDLTEFENAMMHIGESFFGQHAGLDPNNTNAIKEQANTLLEFVSSKKWSEEDERQWNNIWDVLDGRFELSEEGYRSAANWFKSIKDRVQPQPKQEWSEEDINMIDWLIRCCEKEHEELCNDKYGHQDIVSDLKRDCRKKWDWLESLKNRVAPQKQWKPT